jgi:hypothetical protein
MKKLYSLLVVSLLVVNFVFAQKSKTPTPAPRPAPRGPSPYVLKKEYEPKMEEIQSKINAASNAANSAKKTIESKLEKVNQLDSEVQSIQGILNSTTFQLAMNVDSLKETRVTMDELAQKTETNFNHIEETNASLSKMLWIILAASLGATIIVLIVLLSLTGKKMSKLQVLLHMNEEVLKKSISSGLEKQQNDLKEQLNSLESRLRYESLAAKKELSQQFSQAQEAQGINLEMMAARIEKLEQSTTTPDTDPEVFI